MLPHEFEPQKTSRDGPKSWCERIPPSKGEMSAVKADEGDVVMTIQCCDIRLMLFAPLVSLTPHIHTNRSVLFYTFIAYFIQPFTS